MRDATALDAASGRERTDGPRVGEPLSGELPSVSARLEGVAPQETLRWALGNYGGRVTLSVSFGGAEGVVLLDMLAGVAGEDGARVYTLDTGFLFEETVQFREEVMERYPNLTLDVVRPRISVAEQVEKYGDELWSCAPDLCCEIRKVEPQQRWLSNFDAWITGIRREQTTARSDTPVVGRDEFFEVDKVAPLAGWTKGQVDEYVEEHDLALNPLLARGYRSIGCEPCTRPVSDEEDDRAGRWSGSGKIECGLHIANGRVSRAVS